MLNYIKNTRLEVCIKTQKAKFFKNNNQVWESDVLTGSKESSTPKGLFILDNKTYNKNLTCFDNPVKKTGIYTMTAKYWFPFFSKAYGLHDTKNRTKYGLDEYKTNGGTRGCITMPLTNIESLNQLINAGDQIAIYENDINEIVHRGWKTNSEDPLDSLIYAFATFLVEFNLVKKGTFSDPETLKQKLKANTFKEVFNNICKNYDLSCKQIKPYTYEKLKTELQKNSYCILEVQTDDTFHYVVVESLVAADDAFIFDNKNYKNFLTEYKTISSIYSFHPSIVYNNSL